MSDPITGKPYKTRYVMDEPTALRRHPDAQRVPGTLEVRELPETPEESRHEHARPGRPG